MLAVSEIQMLETHGQNNMPFILAGGAGGKLKGQRWLKFQSQPHNNLLVSIQNLFGGGGSEVRSSRLLHGASRRIGEPRRRA